MGLLLCSCYVPGAALLPEKLAGNGDPLKVLVLGGVGVDGLAVGPQAVPLRLLGPLPPAHTQDHQVSGTGVQVAVATPVRPRRREPFLGNADVPLSSDGLDWMC